MTDQSAGTGKAEDMSELQALARLRDLDRRLSSQRVHLWMVRWLFLPVMLVILVGMIVGLIMGFGSPGPVLGGILAIAGGAAGIAEWARRQADDLVDLEEDRNAWVRDRPSLQRRNSVGYEDGRLGPPMQG